MTSEGDTPCLLPGVNGRMSRLIIPLGFSFASRVLTKDCCANIKIDNKNVNKRRFDDTLENQFMKRRRKEEISPEKRYKDAIQDYILAIYFHEQYHPPRCWLTLEVAGEFYSFRGSETERLAAVKEQILIRYIILGWELDCHAWSEERRNLYSKEL